MAHLDYKKTWIFFGIFVALVLIVTGYYFYLFYKDSKIDNKISKIENISSEPVIALPEIQQNIPSSSPTPEDSLNHGAVVYDIKYSDGNKTEIKGYFYDAKTGKSDEIANWSFDKFSLHSLPTGEMYVSNPIQTSPNMDFAVYSRTKKIPGMDAGEGPTQFIKYDFKTKKEDILLSLENENSYTKWLLSSTGEEIAYTTYKVDQNTNEEVKDLYKLNVKSKEITPIAKDIGKYTKSDMAWYPNNHTVSFVYIENNSDYYRYSIDIDTNKVSLTPWYKYEKPDYTSTFPPTKSIYMISSDRQKTIFEERQADDTWKIKTVNIATKEFSDLIQLPLNYAPREEKWSNDNKTIAIDYTPYGLGGETSVLSDLLLIDYDKKTSEKIDSSKFITLYDWSFDGINLYYIKKDSNEINFYTYDKSLKQKKFIMKVGDNEVVLNVIN